MRPRVSSVSSPKRYSTRSKRSAVTGPVAKGCAGSCSVTSKPSARSMSGSAKGRGSFWNGNTMPGVRTSTRRCLPTDSGSRPCTSLTSVGAARVTRSTSARSAAVGTCAAIRPGRCSPSAAFSASCRVTASSTRAAVSRPSASAAFRYPRSRSGLSENRITSQPAVTSSGRCSDRLDQDPRPAMDVASDTIRP